MGHIGSYSGSGGKPGKDLRDGVGEWLDQLPADPAPSQPDQEQPRLDPDVLLNVVQLLRPRSGGGSGGGGSAGGGGGGGGTGGGGSGSRSGGGPRRSAAGSAGSAGRAAAAAYAFRAGDAAALEQLGLDYGELTALGDSIQVARRIVEAACGPRANSTIEDHEQRLIAAEVAEWVVGEEGDGYVPTPEEIVRKTIAIIIAGEALVETGEITNQHDQGEVAESEIRDAAEALADRATLSVEGVTEAEFTSAIESGIETLRKIKGAA